MKQKRQNGGRRAWPDMFIAEPIERRPSKSIKNPKGAGRPRVINRVTTKTSQEGLRDGLTRATFIVPEKTLKEIKDIVFEDKERRPLKDHIAEALSDYVKKIKDKEVKMFRKKKQEADWASIVEHLSGLEPKRMDRLVEIAKDMRTNKHNLDVFINGRPDEVDRLEKGLKEAK